MRSRVSGETGDTMLEVVVAALLVALIAAGVLTGFGQVGSLSGGQRQRAQATALAQADEARLRGLSVVQLTGTAGNATSSTSLDGTTYTVTSSTRYITGGGNPTCSAGQTGNSADEIATTSSVTWPNMGNRPPVQVHSVVTPPVGGAVVVSATTGTAGATGPTGLAGMTASLTGGPTPTTPLVTDGFGCAIFPGLATGTYTLALTPPTGYITPDGVTGISSQSVAVSPTQTQYVTAPAMAQPGSIAATFSTALSTGATGTTTSGSDQINIWNTLLAGPRVYGTRSTASTNTFSGTVNTGANVYPTEYPLASGYTVEGGSCTSQAAGYPTQGYTSVNVLPGQTAAATIQEPAFVILPYTGTPGANWTQDDAVLNTSNATIAYTPSSSWSISPTSSNFYQNNEHESHVTNATATITFNGTAFTWIGELRPQGGLANVTLDGTPVAGSPISLYAAAAAYQQPIWSVSGLAPGQHTVVIQVSATKGAGGGQTVSVDEITGTGAATTSLMTTKPNIIVTDTDPGPGCGTPDYPPTQVPNAVSGALQFPGLPWGSYSICVDNGTGGSAVHDTVNVLGSSLSFSQGNPIEADLFSGGVGNYGTGPCQSSPTPY